MLSVEPSKEIPILGNQMIQKMDLVRVYHHNVMAVNSKMQFLHQHLLSNEQILKEYPDVFRDTGKLGGQYKLEIDENAKSVVHPP